MRHLLAQPKGLYPLCFTELWERFGFYTIQAILILYLTKGLGYPDEYAYLLYGTFTSLVYFTPVLGGYLADRFLGFNQSITWGGILFVIGYAMMAIPSEHALFLGMSIVIVANGLFKPNVSSMVGDLYSEEDPRRDSGYTIFYMGINIGALLPPLFTGTLVDHFGWNWGFLVASFGLVIGLVTYFSQRKRLSAFGPMPKTSPLHQHKLYYIPFFIGLILAIILLHILFFVPKQTNLLLIGASLLVFFTVLYYLFKEGPLQRRKLWACLLLILISVGFWAVYVQTFTSLTLFADRNMSKEFLGLTIDAEFTQFFNPFFIIALSPFLSWFWIWLDNRSKNPSTPMKFALGIFCLALGFSILGAATRFLYPSGLASPWWLVTSYFLQTMGELLISPIGLAMITRLAPRHLVGMMMGVWFLTQAAAFAIGGSLATWADVPKGLTGAASLAIYSNAFLKFGALSFVLALIAFALVPYIKKLIHEKVV